MADDKSGGAAVADKPTTGGADGGAAGAGAGAAAAGGSGAGNAADGGAAGSAGGAPAKPDAAAADGGAKPESLLGGAQTEPKPGEGKPGDAPKAGAPEKGYADFKLPEGMKASPELMQGFKDLAKAENLSQEGAQKLVDLQTAAVLAEQKAYLDAVSAQKTSWAEETKKALGADWKKELAHAARAMDQIGGALKLRDALVALGIDNHPVIAQFLVKVGKGMGEDKQIEGDRSGVVDERQAALVSMFPSMFHEDGTRKQ